LIALATDCDAPLTRVAARLTAVITPISPTAMAALGVPASSPSLWTYSAKTTAMNALDAVYCSQVSQPVMKPAVGPKARAAIG
jgi:hypothetical protein